MNERQTLAVSQEEQKLIDELKEEMKLLTKEQLKYLISIIPDLISGNLTTDEIVKIYNSKV